MPMGTSTTQEAPPWRPPWGLSAHPQAQEAQGPHVQMLAT